MALAENHLSRFSMFMMNPMVRKLDKVEEHAEHHSTYRGITIKTLFLLVLTVVGAVIFFMTNSLAPTAYNYSVEGYTINLFELAIVVATLLLTAIGPWIAFKFVHTSMFLGSLYSIAQGYALAFVTHVLGEDYLYPCLFAFGLTIIVVAIMLIIYRMKLININRKFISLVVTMFFTMIVLYGLLYLSNCFPQTQFIYQLVIDNSIFAIVGSLFGIGLVCLFLLVDFEVIHHCVSDQLPKKYEWLAAFALSFSIIALYMKILNLILKLGQKQH